MIVEKNVAECMETCKSDFKCTDDPCLNNKCHDQAVCVPDTTSHSYSCQCKQGYEGDGFSCEKVHPVNYCAEHQHSCLSPCVCVNQFSEGGYM